MPRRLGDRGDGRGSTGPVVVPACPVAGRDRVRGAGRVVTGGITGMGSAGRRVFYRVAFVVRSHFPERLWTAPPTDRGRPARAEDAGSRPGPEAARSTPAIRCTNESGFPMRSATGSHRAAALSGEPRGDWRREGPHNDESAHGAPMHA